MTKRQPKRTYEVSADVQAKLLHPFLPTGKSVKRAQPQEIVVEAAVRKFVERFQQDVLLHRDIEACNSFCAKAVVEQLQEMLENTHIHSSLLIALQERRQATEIFIVEASFFQTITKSSDPTLHMARKITLHFHLHQIEQTFYVQALIIDTAKALLY